MLSVAAAPEQWLGRFMRLCVIFINQLSRGTPGKENGVRRTRGKELRREAKSEECRGGAGGGGGGGLSSSVVVLHQKESGVVIPLVKKEKSSKRSRDAPQTSPGRQQQQKKGSWQISKFGNYLLQFINDLPCYGQLLRGGNNRIIIVEVVISPSGGRAACR